MTMTVTKKQLVSIKNLLQNLIDLQNKRVLVFGDFMTLKNDQFPGLVFVKYHKTYTSGDLPANEFKMCQIGPDGETEFLDAKPEFSGMMRYAFLQECVTFELDNPSTYQVI